MEERVLMFNKKTMSYRIHSPFSLENFHKITLTLTGAHRLLPNKLMQNVKRSNLIRLGVAKIKGEWVKQYPLGK